MVAAAARCESIVEFQQNYIETLKKVKRKEEVSMEEEYEIDCKVFFCTCLYLTGT
jgi:hypothetical protein